MNEIIDSLWVLRKTRDASKKFYPQGDNIGYLKKCSEILHTYFSCRLGEKYLYSALSHKKSGNSFDLVGSENSGEGYNFVSGLPESIQKKVKEISRKAKNGDTINLTNALLSEEITFDFYFLFNKSAETYSYSNKNRESIWQEETDKWLCFDDFVFEANFIDFKTEKDNIIKINDFILTFLKPPGFDFERTAEYLHNYCTLGQEFKTIYPKKEFILHLVSPGGISEFQYNLLLSLATSKPLSRQEFAEINFVLYRLVSQTAIEQIKEANYQNLLILRSGMGHFLKNRVFASSNSVEKIKAQNTTRNKIIDENCKILSSSFTSLGDIGKLFQIISDAIKNKSVFSTTDGSINKTWVQKEEIYITNVLQKFIDNVFFSKKSLTLNVRFNYIGDSIDHICILPFIKNNDEVFLPKEWIYRELIYEFVLNAGKYAPSQHDIFEMEIVYNSINNLLILSNKVKDDQIEFITQDGKFNECIETFNSISKTNLPELSGLAFVDEFLNISGMGSLFAKLSINMKRFYIGLKLNGLTQNK
jgi:hypothetical protein